MPKLQRHRLAPALAMTAVTAIPILTAAEIIVHQGRSAALPPTGQPHHPTGGGKGPGATPTRAATPGPQPTPVPSRPSGTFTGGTYPDLFGYLSASITVANGKIVSVHISAPMDNPTSAYINSQAVPLLRQETLQAQSNQINAISGATATSQAFYSSLTDALHKAGL